MLHILKRFASPDDFAFYVEKAKSYLGRVSSSDESETKHEDLVLPSNFRLIARELTDKRVDSDINYAWKYLAKRGLTRADMWYYKFGISSELPGRVIMPSFDREGKLNFWTARSIFDVKPKYVDPPRENVRKNEIIFNEMNIDWQSELVIVEGPFDMVKCPTNATALRGNQLSEKSRLLTEITLNSTPCVVFLDDDATDRANNITKLLTMYGIHVRRASTGKFHDPGEMSCDDVALAIKNAHEVSWEDRIRDRFSKLTTNLSQF